MIRVCERGPVVKVLWSESCSQGPVVRVLWSGSCGQGPVVRVLWSGSCSRGPMIRSVHGVCVQDDALGDMNRTVGSLTATP